MPPPKPFCSTGSPGSTAYGAPDGNGWKVPTQFSEFGFTYGAYDPGQTAAIALGCLFIYLRNGHDLAATWARRLLDDLRENRLDPVFGGYQSDYHYAWLNGLVLRAFGWRFGARPARRLSSRPVLMTGNISTP